MSTWTVTTTAAEDDAIHYAYQQSQKPPILGMPGNPVTPAAETEAQFFDRMVHQGVIAPMGAQQRAASQAELSAMLGTIPPENQAAAVEDIAVVVEEHGGTVPLHEARYLYSNSTAPPPRDLSVEVDATDANFAQVTKIFFDHLDADSHNRMSSLMGLVTGTVIRLADAANAATFLQVFTKGAPIQRQGADGHVEIAVQFSQRGGSFATLDTKPLTVTFT